MVLDGLDDIDWERLRHAYSSAADVPELLRALLSDDARVRDEAIGEVHGNIWASGHGVRGHGVRRSVPLPHGDGDLHAVVGSFANLGEEVSSWLRHCDTRSTVGETLVRCGVLPGLARRHNPATRTSRGWSAVPECHR